MIANYTDFSGGYATDLAPESFEDSMLQTAENVLWRQKLTKRGGASTYSTTDLSSFTAIRGSKRGYINSNNYTIIALDDGSNVNFYYSLAGTSGTTLTAIDNDFDWTTGINVTITYLEQAFVATNGTDDPCIIYYSSGWVIKTLDEYDTRTYTIDDWWAGQYTASGTVYTDDSADAKSSTADDFDFATATNDDGFYVACTFPFTKLILKEADDLGTTVVAAYQYYKGDSTWGTLTMVTTPTWTADKADRTLEWDWPTDWEVWDGDETEMTGRYVIRVSFTTADTAGNCDYLQVYHTQYLTQILGNEKPHYCCTHQNRVYLFYGNTCNYSRPYFLTGWNEFDTEYFADGGDEVIGATTLNQGLCVLKEGMIYMYLGDTFENRILQPFSSHGAVAPRSIVSIQGTVYYVAKDGIRAFNGTESQLISRHIETDIKSWTLTNACATNYRGEYWVSFPTNTRMLQFDPDTYRTLDVNEYHRVSFYKLTGILAHHIEWYHGGDDNGYLIAMSNKASGGPVVLRLENGNGYDATATTIAVDVKTRRISQGSFQQATRYLRVKPDQEKGGDYTFTIYGEHERANTSVTISSGTGGGHYTEDISIPYTCDGDNISFRWQNSTVNALSIYGFSLEYKKRRF